MPILGLVLRLDTRGADHDELCTRLLADPRIELGVAAAGGWPLVATLEDDGDSERACLDLHEELSSWPGVARVEVAFTEVVAPWLDRDLPGASVSMAREER